jgi:hybrid cluster-associated redox disulfide protein
MKKINKDEMIADVIRRNPRAGRILFQEGLTCGGCPIAINETIEQGCLAHGMDPAKILKKLNAGQKKKVNKKKDKK